MRRRVAVAAGLLLLASQAGAGVPSACRAQSGNDVVPLVELYTSEGCDSCPAADRWLSANFAALSSDAIALAFHVDYWDRLGWKDRFASAAYTQRQNAAMRANGTTFIYTPQVLVQGRDHREWRQGTTVNALASARKRNAQASIAAEARSAGDDVVVSVEVDGPALRRLRAFVGLAYVDSGLVSEVKAGENRGARLLHDHVVRAFQTRSLDASPATLSVTLRRPAERGRHARVVVFVQDRVSGQVIQALALPLAGCI